MNEDVLIQLLQDINRENVRFGTVEVSFTFHDGRPKVTSLQPTVAGTLILFQNHLTTT